MCTVILTLQVSGVLFNNLHLSWITLQWPTHGDRVSPRGESGKGEVNKGALVSVYDVSAAFEALCFLFQPEKLSVRFSCLFLEWRPGSTGQILSDLDVTSQKEGRWRRLNTLAHYNVSVTP